MSILSDEITNDPLDKGYAALLPDQPGHVVDLLNAKTETRLGIIDRTELTIWAASTGMRAVIEDTANNSSSLLRSSALAILDVLKGSSTGIDLSKPENAAILTGWEQAGALSTENKNSMIALATHPASRAEVLGIPFPVTEQQLRDR